MYQHRGATEPRLFADWEVGGRVWRAKGPSCHHSCVARCWLRCLLDGVWLVYFVREAINNPLWWVGGQVTGQGDVGLGDAIRKGPSLSTLRSTILYAVNRKCILPSGSDGCYYGDQPSTTVLSLAKRGSQL